MCSSRPKILIEDKDIVNLACVDYCVVARLDTTIVESRTDPCSGSLLWILAV